MTEITKKDFEKLNLRVGKIKAVKPHPKTKDYVLLISLGPAGTEKQLVADLKEGYTKEELLSMKMFQVDPLFSVDRWNAHWQEILDRKSFTIETINKRKGDYSTDYCTADYIWQI